MKISLDWLGDYITFKKDVSLSDIVWRITEAVAEVEFVEETGAQLQHCVVGKILELKKHPNADKLQLCKVDIGNKKVQIVCGGINLKQDMLVAVSLPGASVRWHGMGEPIVLQEVTLRGEKSFGMICVANELGLEAMFPFKDEAEVMDLSSYAHKQGTPIAEALGLKDTVLHIDNHAITHRPDLFSHMGFARECVALNIATWKKKNEVKISKSTQEPSLKVICEETDLFGAYQAIAIKNLDNRLAPLWMRRRLVACGIRAINAIVDITNYVMLDTGMPPHAFDIDRMPGKDFTIRSSKKGEKVKTLDGIERIMPENIITIESGKKIVDLSGVMGGENSGIADTTKNVFFHCVNYNPVKIRKAMIALGHRTDAGTIFEKGIAFGMVERGMDKILELVEKIFPDAEIASKRVIVQNEKPTKRTVTIHKQKAWKIMGISINDKETKRILEALEFEVKITKDEIRCVVPFYRANGINIPQDIIEELVRVYGYSKIPKSLPHGAIRPPVTHRLKTLTRTLRTALVGQGFFEEYNFSFISKDLIRKREWNDMETIMEIKNPVSDDFRYLRPCLLPYLLQNAGRNIRQNDVIRSFEIQKTFAKDGENAVETIKCTGIITGKESVLHIKGAVEIVFNALGIQPEYKENQNHSAGHPGRTMDITYDGKIMGSFFEIKPNILRNFDIQESVSAFALNLNVLEHMDEKEKIYKKISKFPSVPLDISIVVNNDVRASRVQEWITRAETILLQNVELKDIYIGANLGENKKSLTYNMVYQADDRTLEEKEIQKILNEIIANVEKNGGVIRR